MTETTDHAALTSHTTFGAAVILSASLSSSGAPHRTSRRASPCAPLTLRVLKYCAFTVKYSIFTHGRH
jgi:hypothetical protein